MSSCLGMPLAIDGYVESACQARACARRLSRSGARADNPGEPCLDMPLVGICWASPGRSPAEPKAERLGRSGGEAQQSLGRECRGD